ncbi:MAG: hypothetical protein AMS24_05120 [Chlamydiae bacterium SM23_39]|nr:MAG: hypothetical protein AMS24_05120 [Chlamydiae bacterium SM23_39]
MQNWKKFLDQQKKELGEDVFNKWLLPFKVIKFDARNIYLKAKDEFQANWFKEHISHKLKDFRNDNDRLIKVHIIDSEKKKTKLKKEINFNFLKIKQDIIEKDLTFSSFFTSEKNVLVYRFLKNLIDKNEFYNPIFIYGPSGSGKTHLITAYINALKEKSNKKIFFVNAKTFTSHVVGAIRLGAIQKFRNIYRNQNILVVDDIHILSGKTATQEEFFHTFNSLYSQNCQIILTSNTPPNRLKEIESRLISRFEWGIILNIDNIDENGRIKILEKKIEKLNLNFSKEAFDFLINKFTSTLSLLKAINLIFIRISKKDILLTDITEHLKDILEEQKEKELTPEKIINIVAKFFGLLSFDILGKSQTKECSFPRHLAMYLLRKNLNLTYQEIGKIFQRDHSTVMSSIKSIFLKEKELFFTIKEIEQKI